MKGGRFDSEGKGRTLGWEQGAHSLRTVKLGMMV
jgi:hypothetical protein